MRFTLNFNENQQCKCDPISTLLVGAGSGATATAGLIGSGGAITAGGLLSLGSTIFGMMGAASSADAQAAAYESQRQAAQYNADITRQEAAAEEARRRRESQRQLASIRTGVAKSGAAMTGTPLMVLAESAEMSELDALNARWSGQTSAALYDQQASSASRAASTARKAKPYAVGSSLLTGAARIGSRSIT